MTTDKNKLNEKSVLIRSDLVNVGNFEGDLVVYHTMSKNYFVITHTGSFIWDNLNGKNSILEIAKLMTQTWDINVERGIKECMGFLEGLFDFGLVEIRNK
jgi:hypothetical protein